MTTDDDKQSPEPDPWAGLDIGGTDNTDDLGAFDFAGLEDEPSPAFDPVVEEPPVEEAIAFSFESTDPPAEEPVIAAVHDDAPGTLDKSAEQVVADVASPDAHPQDAPPNEIPLAVFPPPEIEADGSDVLIGTGRSGIIPMAEVADDQDVREFAAGDRVDDEFDDKDIAHELGLADLDGETQAESDGGLGTSADFGEPVGEALAEDVSFDTGMSGGGFPFADQDQLEQHAESVAEAWGAGNAEAATNAFPAAVVAAGAAAAAAATVSKPAKKKTKGGGFGQMVGVVLGGLMSLPVAYAILIWGFHKDPFKLAKKAPPQLAFLLPEHLQPGAKPLKKAESNRGPKAGPSLDDIPTDADVATVTAEPSADAEGTEPTEPTEPMNVAQSGDEPGDLAEPAKPDVDPGEMARSPEPADASDEAVTPNVTPDVATNQDAKDATDAFAEVAVAPPRMAAAAGLDEVPGGDALPGLDDLVADAVVPAAMPPALPPLDMSGVEAAVERASQAFDALGAISDSADPARDRLAVAWYRRLAHLGEELVRLESVAADTGRPLSDAPAAATTLFERICESDTAKHDLDRLGLMWLTKQKQRADGVTLLATLDSARQVGPYWSMRALVSNARADDADRAVAVISRLAPPAETGERIMISGVLFDGDTVWAADVRPVDRPRGDFGQE